MTGDASRRKQALSMFFSILMVGSVVAIGGVAFAGSAAAQQAGQTVTVDNLQDLRNNVSGSGSASPGDTILLDEGDYNAGDGTPISVTLNNITIKPAGGESPTINFTEGGTDKSPLIVEGNNVSIQDLELVEEVDSRPGFVRAVRVTGDDAELIGNVIKREDIEGRLDGFGNPLVVLKGASPTVKDNQIAYGAVSVKGSGDVVIENNTISTHRDAPDQGAIFLFGTGGNVDNLTIEENDFSDWNATGTKADISIYEKVGQINGNDDMRAGAVSLHESNTDLNSTLLQAAKVTTVESGGTIGDALTRSSEDYTVLVLPGAYNEAVNISTANVTLESAAGPDATTINASGSGEAQAVLIGSSNVTVEGFTIAGSYTPSDGANAENKVEAITVYAGGSAEGIEIANNHIENFYGALYFDYRTTVTDAVVEANTIEDVFYGVGQLNDDGTHIVNNDISAQVQGVAGSADNFVIENNTITVNASTTNNEGGFSQERAIDVGGDHINITGNDISSTATGILVTSGAGSDLIIAQNNIAGDNYAINASDYGHELQAVFNWWGSESGPAADDVQGDVLTDAFLTVPSDEAAESTENLTEFGFTVEMDAGAHAFGVPGPVEGTVGSIFNDFNGTVYAYADGEWTQATADRELSALDALVVIPEEGETARATIEIAEGSGTAAPSSKELDSGWNFVGAPQDGSIESAYAASSADPARALNLYDAPTVSGTTWESPWTKHTFGTDAAGPSVSSVSGYWVYAEADGSVAANVPAGVTYEQFEELTDEPPR